jgi:recombination protein RecA
LKFYSSVRLDVRRVGAIKEAAQNGKDMAVVGNRTRVKVVKNKMAAPFREVEFDILYGQGISRSSELVDMASDVNIVQKSGAWFAYDGERIGQGRDNARTYLEQHPEMMERIEAKLLEQHSIRRTIGAPVADASSDGSKPSESGSKADARKEAKEPASAKAPVNGVQTRKPATPRPS